MPVGGIESFWIEDNGIGFDPSNFESFFTSDSLRKSSRGGRGIGRFLWLKAFDKADIESHYPGLDGKMRQRAFTFSVTDDVPDDKTNPSKENGCRTIVKLIGMKEPYRTECPKRLDVVAQRLIEHCLPLFLNPKCPQVELSDENASFNLNKIFQDQFEKTALVRNFEIEGESFRMRGFRLRNVVERHSKLVYAANYREVVTEKLDRYIANLRGRLEDEQGGFYYLGYVEGDFLDQHVMGERIGFSFPSGEDRELTGTDDDTLEPENGGQSESLFKEISLRDIRSRALDGVREDLQPILVALDESKKSALTSFVEKDAPWHRFWVKDIPLERIRPDRLDAVHLDLVLHQWQYERERQIKKESAALMAATPSEKEKGDYQQKFKQVVERLNELGTSKLSQYIVHRRIILDFFEKSLQRNEETDGYELEETIHNLIFPMKTTSDDVPFEQQNLWIIDERLTYHSYLASDQPIKAASPIVNGSAARPDLLIFDRRFAFSEGDTPLTSIVIVEFKKPDRDNYRDEDPVEQVIRQIRDIKDGHFKDKKGRPVKLLNAQVPSYAYVVCDIGPKLKLRLESRDMQLTPDGLGYYQFVRNLSTYIEVISYEKLLSDAKKRNRVLFDKLHLPLQI
jgi:hypothetical protein